jgi:hypothetical protein
MIYDLDSRILFSGNFMGSVDVTNLFASRADWSGMRDFHRFFMPSKEAILRAVRRIRELQPAPLMIAPQHGSIIKAEDIPFFLDQMDNLPIGLDSVTTVDDTMSQMIAGMNEIISIARITLGDDHVARTIQKIHTADSPETFLTVSVGGDIIGVTGDPAESVESLIRIFFKTCDEDKKNELNNDILQILKKHNLMTFDTLLADEYQSEDEIPLNWAQAIRH